MKNGIINSDRMNLEQCFEKMARQLEKDIRNGWRFCVKICGYIIELRFCSEEELKRAAAYLRGQIVQKEESRDAFFHIWTDDYTRYFSVRETVRPWIFEEEDVYIQLMPGKYFLGVNWKSNSYYFCRQTGRLTDIPYRILPLLRLWSKGKNMRMLHGAVVGLNGKGVLITAHGGGGKSTLAVACLLAGMDFISDDCCLINNQGPLRAKPVETVIKLHADSMEQLKPSMPIIWDDSSRNHKKTLDASEYRFCEELSIEAVIYPKITVCEEPQIIAAPPIPVLMQLVHSTLEQVVTSNYTRESQAIFKRFFGLPTYEMQLSSNLNKNAEAVRTFIEGRL